MYHNGFFRVQHNFSFYHSNRIHKNVCSQTTKINVFDFIKENTLFQQIGVLVIQVYS